MRARSGLVLALLALVVSLVAWMRFQRVEPRARKQPGAPAEIAPPASSSIVEPPVRETLALAPAVDPARLEELRKLGARVLEAFEVQRVCERAMPAVGPYLSISERIRELRMANGELDWRVLTALVGFGSALSAHEDELVEAGLALSPSGRSSLATALLRLDTPALRNAAVRLARSVLDEGLVDGQFIHVRTLMQELRQRSVPEAREFFLGTAAWLRPPLWTPKKAGHPEESMARQAIACVARMEDAEAAQAIRELLESPDENVRTVSADAVADAISEGARCPVADELRTWAADVVRGVPSPTIPPRLAWSIHAREGQAALDALLRVSIPPSDSWDVWFADYRAWVRAVVRAAEHAEPAAARQALYRLVEEAPPHVTRFTFDERKLVLEAIARLGTSQDFELLRSLVEQHESDVHYLLDRFPAQLWKGHESVLLEIVGKRAQDPEENETLVTLGLTTLVQLGVDPGVQDTGDGVMARALSSAKRHGNLLRKRDLLTAKLEETKALSPLERVRAFAAALPGLREVRGEFLDALRPLAKEAATSAEGPALEAALLDPALALSEVRLPLLAALLDAARADRSAILGRVLPLLMERDCPGSAWATLQAAAILGVLGGREERAPAGEVLARWETCRPKVSSTKPVAPVQLLREFLAEADELGLDRVYEE